MKVSVVIPCHNKLDLLKKAIYTVLQQKEGDWELLIFDNASKDDIKGYVDSLSDFRIRFQRCNDFLSVTESWNRAINMASGDYVVFLGDDDGLIPDFFTKVKPLLEEFSYPEIIYSSAYQFMYPGVAPWAPGGYLAEVKNGFFFQNRKKPFLLSKEDAFKAFNGSFNFKRNFSLNIQSFLFKRSFLDKIRFKGAVFHSSFPDYYLSNVTFAKAQTLVISPRPHAIIGVSKCSVGYSLFNKLEDSFNQLLNVNLKDDPWYDTIKDVVLPGPSYNTHYMICMHHVAESIKPEHHLKVNVSRYRSIQIHNHLVSKKTKLEKLAFVFSSKTTFYEKIYSSISIFVLLLVKILLTVSRTIAKTADLFFKLADKTLSYIRKKTHMIAFVAVSHTHNENDFSKLEDIYNYLENSSRNEDHLALHD